MPECADLQVSACLVTAAMQDTVSSQLRLQMGKEHQEAMTTIRQAFLNGTMLIEQPLDIRGLTGGFTHLGLHKDLPCHSVIASSVEIDSALRSDKREATELGLALKVTAPLRLHTRDGTGKRIAQHIKTDVFLNGELVDATSRICRLKKQPVVEEEISVLSGLRVHRQVELPFIYRTDRTERAMVPAISQQQRWNSVALALVERAREIKGTATDSGPPSAEYLANLAEIELPEQLESSAANFAIIDVLITAGQMGREHSTGTYIKEPTLLKDPRYHTRDVASTKCSPQKTVSTGTVRHSPQKTVVTGTVRHSPQKAVAPGTVRRSPQTLTTAYPSGHVHGASLQVNVHASHSLLPQGAHFGTLSRITPSPYHSGPSSPDHYIAHENLDPRAMALQLPPPGFLLHSDPSDAEVFEYPPPPPAYGTPIARRNINSPLRGTENMSPQFSHVGSPFSPRTGFNTEIMDGINTYGTPVRQMVAVATSGEVYELTPVKLQLAGHHMDVRRGPQAPLTQPSSTIQRESRPVAKRCATSDMTEDGAVLGADSGTIHMTGSGRRTHDTVKSVDPFKTDPKTSRKRSRNRNGHERISVDSSSGKSGSNRSSTRWNPSEDTIEQALQKFEVPLLCKDSVVSFANTDAVRQIAKARTAEFIEEDFVVGIRFVVY